MKIGLIFAAGALAATGVALTPAPAEARTYVSVGFGSPGYYGGYYGGGYYGGGYYSRPYYGRPYRGGYYNRGYYGPPRGYYDRGYYGRPRYWNRGYDRRGGGRWRYRDRRW